MDIGEAVAVLVNTGGPKKCPFCDSKAGPNFEKKEMVNDAAVLAKNAGGMPYDTAKNPESVDDYYIFEKYWISDDESQIVLNPHHVLPGNASLARCPQILKWMAGTTSVKKEEHSKTVTLTLKKIMAKVKRFPKSQRATKLKVMFKQSFPAKPIKEAPGGIVVFALDGDKVDGHSKPVSDNYVTGQITFDVNDGPNCIWLPSHCALESWSDMEGLPAWHMDQDSGKHNPITFEVAYAYNTMKKTRVQFHDAHPEYSTAVIKELKKLDFSLQKLADKCLMHPNTKSKKNGPYPAPQQLTASLYKLAELCKKKLNLKKTKPAKPWYTSKLALEVRKIAK
ncbi:MAG: hypothetical protein HZB55_17785 [Deltaproteobacteria bacterium]|nr:hypothetical protein [Deltaproteobacteria bacterium]